MLIKKAAAGATSCARAHVAVGNKSDVAIVPLLLVAVRSRPPSADGQNPTQLFLKAVLAVSGQENTKQSRLSKRSRRLRCKAATVSEGMSQVRAIVDPRSTRLSGRSPSLSMLPRTAHHKTGMTRRHGLMMLELLVVIRLRNIQVHLVSFS
ncbi:hypothetical protein EYF80_003968 [Liparis tanakae]|uniref:Uncharacterized protein n=1 Tax=Liparis tanakae TaxID=230148 RepID=A0A4Z2J714_9TELE|nr:hypothetical protein EYF80_003968 [Liparis tanakae]